MGKSASHLAGTVLSAAIIAGGSALAQDFQRSYNMAPDSRVRVVTVSGEVTITGYDGREIQVKGIKIGQDKDRVEIVDRSGPDIVDLSVRYPEEGSSNASVNFEVRVPRSVRFNFSHVISVSGSVHLSDLTGQVKANSVSGDVEIRNVRGAVSANSTSGSVLVYLDRGSGPGDMTLSSVSGSVSVRAPAELEANIMMTTVTGDLDTDFPLDIQQRRYGPGSSARGRLGSGASSIRITSVSGSVSLKKR
jgi:hypothetical protein